MDCDSNKPSRFISAIELLALLALFFVYAGDLPPSVNEAHYLVKAKNYWDPTFASTDLFASSGKAHTTFYIVFGWLTKYVSLEASAWIGRLVGWGVLACGLILCCRRFKLPAFASLGVAILWLAGIEQGNLAGEWVVGGIEGKVPAYGFGLIGISKVIQRRWSIAWIWFGIASAFHVLTGGWLVVASMIAFAATEIRGRVGTRISEDANGNKSAVRAAFFSRGLFIGGAIALLGLVPALYLTMAASPEERNLAARIYSYVRIRHHLLPNNFPAHWFIRHGMLVAGMFALFVLGRASESRRRLGWIGIGASTITATGLLVGMLPPFAPDLAAKLLRYYWFRLGDAIVPLVIAIMLVDAARGTSWPPELQKGLRLVAAGALLIGTLVVGESSLARLSLGLPGSASHRLLGLEPNAPVHRQQKSFHDWVAVCRWARTSTPIDEVFLTPRHQQTFKWYSGRGEVVNWKDVPQDAKSLIEWLDRFEDVFPKQVGEISINAMRVPINYSKLRHYRDRYGVRFMVVDNRIAESVPLAKIYPVGSQQNETYSVYELPY
ncbi:hypothetical protein LOC67_00250 [Stieleria sp. JC731]|uniref:DUF6798 domain-containing protein n=1 Tax=Pirellulaceae TaxID=2691357 RepID=UPI001E5F9B10|nr:DUF6798 domain-containing protein [Stieleria sp. JC731]MCC9598970.1 hypothetical protein [Stieleria sp. JC731]